MLEPATHRNWAEQIRLRSQLYGVIETHLQISNSAYDQPKIAV